MSNNARRNEDFITNFGVDGVKLEGGLHLSDLFKHLLPNQVKVDKPILKFFESVIDSCSECSSFVCNLWATESGRKFSEMLPTAKNLTPSHVYAILKELGDRQWDILSIPKNEEEVNILLGFIEVDGKRLALYVEHELEDGKQEEVHLHVASPNHTEDDRMQVVDIIYSSQ